MLSLQNKIFNITTEQEFNALALEIFNYQFLHNSTYNEFCKHLKIKPLSVKTINEIPFLPVEFFKTHAIKTGDFNAQKVFLSSGTTGMTQSEHAVKDLSLYEASYNNAFKQFYGAVEDYCILGLLPSYLECEDSSLIYMAADLIKKSKHPDSAFFLDNHQDLVEILAKNIKNKQKTILFGVSFALLDLAESYQNDLSDVIIMETGGMKGRRKELTRDELHRIYKKSFKVSEIHSEYGMTELLSQAYSEGHGVFKTPNWLRILIRDVNDPFNFLNNDETGGINVIDLANINSCSFIATQDLGKCTPEGFEVLGRFDNSDLRGCNLLIS